MKKQITMLALVLLSGQAALADTETHAVNYNYELSVHGDNYPRLRLPGFDSMNGTRVLERVDVRVQSDIGATLAIENMTNAPLSGWTLEGQHLVLAGFEREDPQTFGPFAFLGGLFIDPITATLAPNDGTPRSGPDYLPTTLSTTIDSTLDMDPSYLDFFNGGGEVVAVVGPFTEFFLMDATQYDPKTGTGDATVEWAELTQAGTFSVIYTYSAVPEPTAAACTMGTLALAATARRRRQSIANDVDVHFRGAGTC